MYKTTIELLKLFGLKIGFLPEFVINKILFKKKTRRKYIETKGFKRLLPDYFIGIFIRSHRMLSSFFPVKGDTEVTQNAHLDLGGRAAVPRTSRMALGGVQCPHL